MRWLAILLCFLTLPAWADDPVFKIDALNEGLEERRDALDLSTPQSAMETFLFAVLDGDFATAAQVPGLSEMRGKLIVAAGRLDRDAPVFPQVPAVDAA